MTDKDRADLADAACAAVLEKAATELDLGAHIFSHHGSELQVHCYQNAAKTVRALITPDMSKALEDVVAEAVKAERERINSAIDDIAKIRAVCATIGFALPSRSNFRKISDAAHSAQMILQGKTNNR